QLLHFNSSAAGTITGTTPITGIQSGEAILAISIRPATGQLYGLGSSGRLYTVNSATGAATQVGSGTFAVSLIGSAFGFAFDPLTDRIRVVSDADQNMRIDPNTGAVVDTDPNTPGTQPDLFLTETYVGGLASATSASGTTLYGIDGANDWLVRVGGPNGNP